MRTTRLLGLVLLPLVAGAPFRKRQQSEKVDQLVVFGDSLSDAGAPNGAISVSNGSWPADPAYSQGRFTNGQVWSQLLASNLSIGLDSYAVGGATSDNTLVQGYTGLNSTIGVPSVADQINRYIAANASSASTHIHAIMIGLNDIFFNPNLTAKQVAQKVELGVTKLQKAGATRFLLFVEPSIARIPYAAVYNTTTAEAAAYDQFTIDYKRNITSFVASLGGKVDTAIVDLDPLFAYVEAHAAAFGIDPAYVSPPQACLTGSYPGTGARSLCSDPDRHLFHDIYHPNQVGHRLIAQAALGGVWNGLTGLP